MQAFRLTLPQTLPPKVTTTYFISTLEIFMAMLLMRIEKSGYSIIQVKDNDEPG